MSGSMMFEKILSIRVLEWLVILVGFKIKGINELDASESSRKQEDRFLFFRDIL